MEKYVSGKCTKLSSTKVLVLAFDCFEKAIEIDDGCHTAHVNLGLVLMKMDKLKEAKLEFQKVGRKCNEGWTQHRSQQHNVQQ